MQVDITLQRHLAMCCHRYYKYFGGINLFKARGMMSKGLIVLVVLAVIIIASFNKIAGYLIDYQWFKELSYTEVFFKKILTQIKFFIPCLIILFTIFYLFIKSINLHSIKYSGIILDEGEKKVRNLIFLIVSFVLSFMVSFVFSLEVWNDYLIFANRSNFGIVDPVFGRDIGFFVFMLPFLNKIYGLAIGVVFLLLAITVLVNLYNFATFRQPNIDENANVRPIFPNSNVYLKIFGAASKQLLLLGGLFFLLQGFGFFLRIFELLYSPRGVAYGAGFADINVTLPSYYVYMAICVVTALLLFSCIRKFNLKLAAFGPLLLVAAMVISGVATTAVQSMIVAPNELAREEKYLQNNIDYTNYAYGLNNVTIKDFPVEQSLTRVEIDNNVTTIKNIPINDYRPAKDIYNQIQGLKNYYQFNDIDIDRYTIDGTYRQVFVSARELLSTNVPKQTGSQSASWINRYLKYTHGYGVAMSPVNEVTSSGQPKLFIRDMPIISDINVKLEKPQLYYGELSKDFTIVNTREKEFDYPASNINVETEYTGTGGIKLNFFNRLLFAVKEGNINFLLSQDINSNSKVLINREIKQRAMEVAPFLIYDEDPYIVISEGKLYWMIDAYTESSKYPYSEPISDKSSINYIRNSVKIVISAYDGSMNFYISDKTDPLIITYSKIFKTLFKPLDAMPADLRAHIRYPQMLFDIQSDMYRKYHMKIARDLYNKSDIWDIATQIYGAAGGTTDQGSQTQYVESAYLITKLPDSNKEEFVLMIPYTPLGKNNMTSWFGVKNDGEDYGELILYRFPSGKIVEGPMQVEGIVSQDTIIGPQLNLLATGGNSQVMRGNMLTIPINKSLLYVEPIYIKALNANALPELKKVIVYYNNKVVMEDTLEKALAAIFPPQKKNDNVTQTTTQPTVPGQIVDKDQLIKNANTLFKESQDALRLGNWAEYGDKLKQLEQALNELQRQSMVQQQIQQ